MTPDLVMVDYRHGRLLVGDAKAADTVGNAATARRLRRYLRAVRPWQRAGFAVRVVLCCSGSAAAWERLLLLIATDVDCRVTAHGHGLLADEDALAWIELGTTMVEGEPCRTPDPSTSLGVRG